MLEIEDLSVPSGVVDTAHNQGYVQLSIKAPTNSYIVLRDETERKHTALVQHVGAGRWNRIRKNNDLRMQNLMPRDSRQAAMLNNLVDPKILVNVVVGVAGTGKTTLALAYALEQWQNQGKEIFLSKPTTMVGEGNAFGPVPGDVEEKYAPYLASYEIALKRLLGNNGAQQVEMMKKRKALHYVPVELIRGSEFENCTFILDEAQNLTWHELKTVVSRMGENTTLIILGDLRQIDTGVFPEETGLHKLIYSKPYQESRVGSAMELRTQYRSAITQLVADVDEWVLNEQRKKIKGN